MGFIKVENQPSFGSGPVHINHNEPQPGQFAFLPYSNADFDNVHPSELHKPGTSDGRAKVARACTECKSRKMRCDGGLPFCGRCTTHSRTKSCAYVDPPKRSPITRQYVSTLETQLEEAKKKIAQLQSDSTTTNTKPVSDKPAAAPNAALLRRHTQPYMQNRSLTGEDTTHACALDTGRPILSSKKRSRSYADGLDDDIREDDAEFGHVDKQDATASASKEDDSLGGGNFVSLTSCNAALQIASQLSAGSQAGANAGISASQALAGHDSTSSSAKAGAIDISCEGLARASSSTSASLPTAASLPNNLDFSTWDYESQRFAAELLESFFEFHLPSHPILHPATFRAQLQGTVCPPSSPAWPMLVNMVFALGALERRISAQEADHDTLFYERAKQLYSAVLFDKAEIISVQALTLMASYCQKKNLFAAAWMVLGSALRMAISMGLHSESALQARDMPAFDREFGRRIWYTLFAMEADTCVSMARPNGLLAINADVAPPQNIDETAMSPTSDQLPAEVAEATVSSTLAIHAKFASEISMPLQARLMRGSNPSIEEVRAFDLKTEEFIDNLPEYMDDGYAGPRPASFSVASARLRWRCNNFRMVMFRPFLLSNAVAAAAARSRGAPRPALRPAVKQAIALCRTTASNNIVSISNFWDSHPHNQAMAWHAIYFLTQSALVPLVSLLDEPSNPEAREWVSLLQTCVRLLVDMGRITPIGAKCKDAIENLAGSLLRDAVDDDSESMILSKWMSEAGASGNGSTAAVDPLMWSSHLMSAGSAGSSDVNFGGAVAHPTGPSLTLSLDSASSDGMSAAFDFARSMDASPGDHRSSIADSIDAWAATATQRPSTASQWSENGPSSLPERDFLHRERIDQWFGLQASHPGSGRHDPTSASMMSTSEPGSSHSGAHMPVSAGHPVSTPLQQPAHGGMDWQTAADPTNWWNVQYRHPNPAPSNNGFMFNNNAEMQNAHLASSGHVHAQHMQPHGHPSHPQHFF
ncbi:Zn(2)-C6 fungal-type DNA-binding domain protein [Kalmanozyma brasiliensis GHG001]|uniref:Zn(2)-C6 fungal-type domain-containing protein n=1 Tax=Kalmanozyma brasiliensis (strain GHG001) TaxID=1365824 RepID=V5E931_KALBG|nr:Zn(2)-C6 fungal-type DNA-binding domain protein [Kalmanozyma brasiliensis GHG001]EST06861.1 Zn(2)-C6 fungal-type DNA-binding domain protein [Kalmanozyma brasiliensis GHG001]